MADEKKNKAPGEEEELVEADDRSQEPMTGSNRSDPAPETNREEDKDAVDPAAQRIWRDPIVVGDPVPFDPEKHAPPMTDEELAEFLDDDDD